MTAIIETVEIARSPEDVFAYLDKLDRHGEWQDGIVSAKIDTEGPVRVGTRVTEVRKVPGGKRPISYEITAHDPPRTSSFRGTNGPVRAVGTVTVDPAGDGRSRVTLDLDFEGRGFGKLLLPLVRRDARKHVPPSQAKLKERLEAGA
jgi:uncharacterized protein YndB with AHSA1/START domain